MWGYRMWGHGRRGWLRPWIISMLSRSPKNGAEIIDEIERMSWGGWRPSPGSVYPLLEDMVHDGILSKREDGRYEVTPKGKEETEFPFGISFGRPNSVEGMLNEISSYASYFEDIQKADPSRLASQKGKIKAIAERLARISNS